MLLEEFYALADSVSSCTSDVSGAKKRMAELDKLLKERFEDEPEDEGEVRLRARCLGSAL